MTTPLKDVGKLSAWEYRQEVEALRISGKFGTRNTWPWIAATVSDSEGNPVLVARPLEYNPTKRG